MVNSLISTLLSLLGKKGWQALVANIAGTDMFQTFLHDLIMKRLAGLQDKPELYASIDGYATALSKVPAVLTDDDPNNTEQLAVLFRLEAHLEEVNKATAPLLKGTKSLQVSLKSK